MLNLRRKQQFIHLAPIQIKFAAMSPICVILIKCFLRVNCYVYFHTLNPGLKLFELASKCRYT